MHANNCSMLPDKTSLPGFKVMSLETQEYLLGHIVIVSCSLHRGHILIVSSSLHSVGPPHATCLTYHIWCGPPELKIKRYFRYAS